MTQPKNPLCPREETPVAPALSELERIVIEVERRWRSRTPATRIDEVNASHRVGRGEMRAWCQEQGIKLAETDEELELALIRMYMRLRAEFPYEQWEAPNARGKELCKQHKIRIPRRKTAKAAEFVTVEVTHD